MWDLPGPGLKAVSPALAGGFLTTAPPGKSLYSVYFDLILVCQIQYLNEQLPESALQRVECNKWRGWFKISPSKVVLEHCIYIFCLSFLLQPTSAFTFSCFPERKNQYVFPLTVYTCTTFLTLLPTLCTTNPFTKFCHSSMVQWNLILICGFLITNEVESISW